VHGIDQDRYVGHALLQEITKMARLVCKQTLGIPRFEVLAENHNGCLRPAVTNRPGGRQPLVGVGGRHANVDYGHVGTFQGDKPQQRLRIAGLAHHLDARVAEQPSHSGPDQHDVVGDYGAHGITASIELDPFSADGTTRWPPTAPIRSAASTKAFDDSPGTSSS